MSKVVLTGSSGFIGQHLRSHLKDNGCDVHSISRSELSDSEVPTESFFYSDCHTDADVVIHLVGAAHRHFTDAEANFINLELTKKVLERAIRLGIPRFIFLSSANVYIESDEAISLDTLIDSSALPNTMQSKLMAEEYIKQAALKHAIDVVIIRSPLVYGEGVKANFASLANLVGKMFPLPFRSIKCNERSLVSVYNLVDLITLCITHPAAANQTFLVSDDQDLSTSEIISLLAEAHEKLNLSIPVPIFVFKMLGILLKKETAINRLVGSLKLDISHTKDALGWKPKFSIEHGFKLSVKK